MVPHTNDFFISSSSKIERFVEIWPQAGFMEKFELREIVEKYHILYKKESQRKDFLKSLSSSSNLSDEQEIEVIKGAAIHNLNKIINPKREFSNGPFQDSFEDFKDSVVAAAGMGWPLYDLGKINIPTDIIKSPGKLSEEYFSYIKGHSLDRREFFGKTRLPYEGIGEKKARPQFI